MNSTNTTGKEYGAEQNRQVMNLTGISRTIVRTSNTTNSFTPNFVWDAVNGYTIGVSHGHPGGSAPSPADVFYMIQQLVNYPDLSNASASDQALYQKNVTITAVTTNKTYVVRVNDWEKLRLLYLTFNADPVAFNNSYSQIASNYYNSHTTDAGTATAYALLTKFGEAINLFGASPNSYHFSGVTINGTGTVQFIIC